MVGSAIFFSQPCRRSNYTQVQTHENGHRALFSILSMVPVLPPPEVEAGRAEGDSDALPREPMLRDGVDLFVGVLNINGPGG